MSNIEWRNISGFNGKYQVSNNGQVRHSKGLILKPNTKSPRYYTVRLYLGSRNKYEDKLIHRLVAETFLGKHDDKYEVNHIDGNRYNNNVSNLEWVTHQENMKHAVLHNLVTTEPAKEAHRKQIKCSNGNTYFSVQSASDDLGVSASCISGVLHGRCKTTGGYSFEFC